MIDDGTLTMHALKQILPQEMANYQVGISLIEIMRTDVLTTALPAITEFYGRSSDFLAHVKSADILVVHKAPVTEEVLQEAKNLKLIACARNTPSNVDLEAAGRLGIPVLNAPGRAKVAAAELTVGLMIALARNIFPAGAQTRNAGSAARNYEVRSSLEGVELNDKTAGIIGFGQIGKEVALKLRAFGMHILVYSTHAGPEEIKQAQARQVSLDTLLRESDFVTLHPQLTRKNIKLLGEKQLNLMKKSAYLINTARGKLIDEQALYRVLLQGGIKGAALDVLENEPPGQANPLLNLKNVLITPHLGGKTREVPVRTARLITANIKKFLEGKNLEGLF